MRRVGGGYVGSSWDVGGGRRWGRWFVLELIMQGVFRSGTTIVFECLRRDPGAVSFYEPLHPELGALVKGAKRGGDGPVKSGLFREYVPLMGGALDRFDPSFAYEHAVLDAEDTAPALEAYLRGLASAGERVRFQFNRAFWMVPWLGRRFPDACFLHIVRDPRSVVFSQMRRRPEHASVALVGGGGDPDPEAVFSKAADHSYYYADRYLSIARSAARLRGEVEGVEGAPFVEGLALWAAQVGVCHREAKKAFGDSYLAVTYERFAREPGKVLEDIYQRLGRACPSDVRAFAEAEVYAPKPRVWHEDSTFASRFEEGFQQAGIEEVAARFGYIAGAPKTG